MGEDVRSRSNVTLVVILLMSMTIEKGRTYGFYDHCKWDGMQCFTFNCRGLL